MLNFLNRYQLYIAHCLLICLCPCVFFIPRAAVIFLVLGGVFGWLKQRFISLTLLKHPFTLTIIVLIGWNSLSALWSPNAFTTLILSFRLTGLLIFSLGWISWLSSLDNQSILGLKRSFSYGILFSLALLSFDHILNNPWQSWMVKSSAKAFVPLVLTISVGIWPCLSLFNKNNVGKQLFIALTLIILFFVDCDTSLVSIIGGGIAYLCYFYLPKLTVKMVKVCGITLMLSLPWLFSNFLTAERIQEINQHIHSVSYIHRLYVWQFVSHKIDGHWVKGYGGDSSRAECVGGELQNWTMVNKQGESINIHSKSIPLHPHNVALQLWLELGVIGAALGAVIYYLLLNQLSFLRVAQGAPLMGFFIAANVIFWINLGCWQSWWLATLGLLWPLSRSHAKLIE